jgi:hypothetical protein
VLPEVLDYFAQYFDIALLGVKERPSLALALEILMRKRNHLLTVESAPKFFAYLNKLDGLSRSLIEQIANAPFIPLSGLFVCMIKKQT